MNKIVDIIIRYALIVIAGLGNLYIFYKIFTPLTIKTIALILNAQIIQNTILFNSIVIEIIPACVAGSAYYLLFILNFSIPNIKIKTRIKILFFTFLSLFALNIARIILLTLLTNSNLFNAIHLIFWYVLSTIFIIAIWILTIHLFKIKSIPFYTDFKYIHRLITKNHSA